MNNVCELPPDLIEVGMWIKTVEGWKRITKLDYAYSHTCYVEGERRFVRLSDYSTVSVPNEVVEQMEMPDQLLVLTYLYIHNPTQLNQLRVSVAMDVYRESQNNE